MLASNMDHVLSMQGIAVAKGIAMSFGGVEANGSAVYAMTGSEAAANNAMTRLRSEAAEAGRRRGVR